MASSLGAWIFVAKRNVPERFDVSKQVGSLSVVVIAVHKQDATRADPCRRLFPLYKIEARLTWNRYARCYT